MVDGHILAIVNFTGVNIRVQVFVWIPVFNLGSVYVGMELLCHGNSMFMYMFLRNCQLFSTETMPFYIPISNVQEFQFLHTFSNFFLFFFSFLNNRQSSECKVVILL